MPAVCAQDKDTAMGQRHPDPHREETLAALDLLGIGDAGDIAEVTVPEIAHRKLWE